MSNEKLYVANVKIALALKEGQDPEELYDTLNMALIPLQRREDGTSSIIDYTFEGIKESPTPVYPYDYDKGFEEDQGDLVTLKGFIQQAGLYIGGKPDYVFTGTEDMAKYGYIVICPHTIKFQVPKDFNLVKAQVDSLRKESDRLKHETSVKVANIDEQINTLLCLENHS